MRLIAALAAATLVLACHLGPLVRLQASPQTKSCAIAFLRDRGYQVHDEGLVYRLRASRTRVERYEWRSETIVYVQDLIHIRVPASGDTSVLEIVRGSGRAYRRLNPAITPELTNVFILPTPSVSSDVDALRRRCARPHGAELKPTAHLSEAAGSL